MTEEAKDDERGVVSAWFGWAHAAEGGSADVPTAVPAAGGVDACDGDGRTALHWAAAEGRGAKVRALLSAGADAQTRDGAGWTPLMSASSAGHAEIVAALLQRSRKGSSSLLDGGEDEENPTTAAAAAAAEAVAATTKEEVNAANARGCTALHYACSKGRADVAEMLLAAGADPSAKDAVGATPLHRVAAIPPAATQQQQQQQQPSAVAVVEMLLGRMRTAAARSALVDARNGAGETALHIAVQMRNEALVQTLLAAGAAADVADKEGHTPAFYAAGNDELCALLLRRHR